METTQSNASSFEFEKLDGNINLRSGGKFNLLDPDPETVHLEDIAAGLAYNAHFGGHSPKMFSIAQHCLLTVQQLPMDIVFTRPELALAALMHDSEEAYTGDVIKPLKVLMPDFVAIADRIRNCIFNKFDISLDLLAAVKPYDKLAQNLEYKQFYKGEHHFNYLLPERARLEFKMQFFFLSKLIADKRTGKQ